MSAQSEAAVRGEMETWLRERRDAGSSLLVPYVTAGVSADWLDHARAFADAGADAIEIGLPFSDPMLDGTVVQAASHRALERGTTPHAAITEAGQLALGLPLVAMTYSNVVQRHGYAEFCDRLRAAGFAGLIVVDMPHDEAEPLLRAAVEHDIEPVMMIAPSTSDRRARQIAELSRGFVYAATVMGPTGERVGVPEAAVQMAARVRQHASVPVLLGFGISTPVDAAAAAGAADGVVIGSAVMRRVLAGAGPAQTGAYVRSVRAALDANRQRPTHQQIGSAATGSAATGSAATGSTTTGSAAKESTPPESIV
jgi:tryptophan synthase alpha chain